MADEIIREVWKAKDDFAKKCNYSIDVMVAELRKIEKQSKRKIVNLAGKRTKSAIGPMLTKVASMTTLTATEARNRFSNLMSDVTQKDKAFRIHHRSGDVVLVSKDYYEGLLESLELMSIPGFRESVRRSTGQMKKKETFSIEEVFQNKRGKNKI